MRINWKFWQQPKAPVREKELSGSEFWTLLRSLRSLSVDTNITGWVFACLNRISQDIETAIIEVYDGERPIQHKLTDYLITPNPYNLREFLYQTTWLLETEGRAVWWLTDEYMIPLPGAQPVLSREGSARIVGYRTGTLQLGLDSLLVIARYHPGDPTRTISPMQALQDVVEADKLSWQWTKSILEKWWHIQYGVRIPSEITGMEIDKLIEELKVLHEGPANAGRPAILPPGTEMISLSSLNPGEMAGKMPYDPVRDRILGVFGVPASILGLVKDVNRANAEANRQVYRENVIAPILTLIAEALTNITPRFGRPAQVYLTLPVSPDPDAIRENILSLTEKDIITINEARRELGYDEVEWGNIPLSVLRILTQQGFYTPQLGKSLKKKALTKATYRREALKVKRKLESQGKVAYGAVIGEFISHIEGIPYADMRRKAREVIAEMRSQKPGFRPVALLHQRAYASGMGFGFAQTGKHLPDWEIEFKQTERVMEVSFQRAERSYALMLDALEREIVEEFPEGLTDEEFADWLAQRYDLLYNRTVIAAARLSVTSEFADGQIGAFAEQGIMNKIWLTTGDDKVRNTHREMEGVSVPLTEDFVLPSGAQGPGPGLLDDDEENWNCRCVLAPEVR